MGTGPSRASVTASSPWDSGATPAHRVTRHTAILGKWSTNIAGVNISCRGRLTAVIITKIRRGRSTKPSIFPFCCFRAVQKGKSLYIQRGAEGRRVGMPNPVTVLFFQKNFVDRCPDRHPAPPVRFQRRNSRRLHIPFPNHVDVLFQIMDGIFFLEPFRNKLFSCCNGVFERMLEIFSKRNYIYYWILIALFLGIGEGVRLSTKVIYFRVC